MLKAKFVSYFIRLARCQYTAHDSTLAQLDHYLPARSKCAENCEIPFVGCEVDHLLERERKQTDTTHQYKWQKNVRLQQF